MAKEKIYFNRHQDSGGIFFVSKQKSSINCMLRLAGKPKFILKECVKRYGKDEGIKKYQEILNIIYAAGDGNYSPFVLYLYSKEHE